MRYIRKAIYYLLLIILNASQERLSAISYLELLGNDQLKSDDLHSSMIVLAQRWALGTLRPCRHMRPPWICGRAICSFFDQAFYFIRKS